MEFHIVLIGLASVLTYLWWGLVHNMPGVLARILPRGLTYGFGAGWLILGLFSAFAAAYVLREPEAMLRAFVSGYVGLWLMLATMAGMRGSEGYEQMLRRVMLMMILLMGVIIASLHAPNPQVMALLNLLLVTGGFWITTNYLRTLDRR